MFRATAVLVFTALTVIAGPACAQGYPTKPVRIVNPFPPGTNTDTVARLLGQILQESWGQPVVVENKTGAGGAVGSDYVAKAAPDGYTLLLTSSSTHQVAPVLRKSLPYDANKDFSPIVMVTNSPHVVLVTNSLPVKNLRDFIEYAKAHPGVSYASSGNGTAFHLAGELFSSTIGGQMLHVPYRGAAPAMNDLIGGQVQAMFDSPGNSAPNIKAGRIRALAVMAPKRWPTLPDVPTTTELGYPQLQYSNWLGLYAPAHTPPEVIAKITGILKAGLSKPGMQERFLQMGVQLTQIYGDDFAKAQLAGQNTLAELAKKANLPPMD